MGVAQAPGGEVHAPAGEIRAGRLAGGGGEAAVESGARDSDLTGQGGGGPWSGGLLMEPGHGGSHHRVVQSPEPGGGRTFHRRRARPAALGRAVRPPVGRGPRRWRPAERRVASEQAHGVLGQPVRIIAGAQVDHIGQQGEHLRRSPLATGMPMFWWSGPSRHGIRFTTITRRKTGDHHPAQAAGTGDARRVGLYSSTLPSADTSCINSAMSVGMGGTASRRTPVAGDHTRLTVRSGSGSG